MNSVDRSGTLRSGKGAGAALRDCRGRGSADRLRACGGSRECRHGYSFEF